MKSIRKNVTVDFMYNGTVISSKVLKKSGAHMLVYVPLTYLGGDVHMDRCYVPCNTVIKVR